MRGENLVILIGNLGADPDLRYTPSGDAVATVSLATDESYRDKNTGQMVPKTEWHRLTLWRKLAESAGQYLKKGAKVYVRGKLQTDSYEKDGVKHYATKIVVNEMRMLGGRSEGSADPQQDAPRQHTPADPFQSDDPNDLIPF